MKISVFTSNQPRHRSLVASLASIASEVFAVQECNTVFPGQIADFFRKSAVMQAYFQRVIEAEHRIFGSVGFLPGNVRSLSIRMGDLNRLDLDALAPALSSDVYVVFGASYIKGALADHLVEHRAVNIHMGASPYYRGSSTNFWALYDRRPEYVGATIHLLSRGLDSGPMLFHALPRPAPYDPFELGMQAVRIAHQALAQRLADNTLAGLDPVPQDASRQLRYTRNADFTDDVAAEYLMRLPAPAQIAAALQDRDLSLFVRPHVA